ncbi:hypothetical protein M5F03_15265 [Acinetobacter sp. ANC 5579]|jgi:hypothetical protein|uniref:hypothetical protein n=1 Tax=Acinetobacter TaxID=469 RepID=UPI0015D27885|nr:MULTISPECIES: hypothetical protein [Acinetobacter]MCL6236486.1 hypothetical protein [Acinetobacter amyesii]UUS65610.1 hypothetical protein MST18_02295 [Acinetobacter sp. YH12068_T]
MSGIIKDKPVHISYRTYLSNRKLKSKKTNKISRLDKQQIDRGERVIRRIVDLIKIEEVEEIYGEVLLALFGTKDLMKLQSKLGILLPLEESKVKQNLRRLGLSEEQIKQYYLKNLWVLKKYLQSLNK